MNKLRPFSLLNTTKKSRAIYVHPKAFSLEVLNPKKERQKDNKQKDRKLQHSCDKPLP